MVVLVITWTGKNCRLNELGGEKRVKANVSWHLSKHGKFMDACQGKRRKG